MHRLPPLHKALHPLGGSGSRGKLVCAPFPLTLEFLLLLPCPLPEALRFPYFCATEWDSPCPNQAAIIALGRDQQGRCPCEKGSFF